MYSRIRGFLSILLKFIVPVVLAESSSFLLAVWLSALKFATLGFFPVGALEEGEASIPVGLEAGRAPWGGTSACKTSFGRRASLSCASCASISLGAKSLKSLKVRCKSMWISPNLKIPQCRRLDYGTWVLGSLKCEVGVDGGLNLTDWICRTAMQIDLWSSPNLTTPRTQTQGYGRWALGSWKCELRLDAAPNTTNWIYWDPMQIDSQSSPKLKIPPNSNASFQLFGSGSSTCHLGLATETIPTNEKTVRELRGGFLRFRSSLRPALIYEFDSVTGGVGGLGRGKVERSVGRRWERTGRSGQGRESLR